MSTNKCGKPQVYAGWGDVVRLMSQVIGVTIIDKGETFTRLTFVSLAAWKTLFADVSAGAKAITVPITKGFENLTPEPTIATANSGAQDMVDKGVPAFVGSIDNASLCDYEGLELLDGHSKDVVLHLKQGGQYGVINSTALPVGIRAKLRFYFTLPKGDALEASYQMWVFFEDLHQFDNKYIDVPPYSYTELRDQTPAGFGVEITTALTTTTAVVKVTKRSDGTGVEGLLAADFTTIDSNADDAGVETLVEDGGGFYTLTLSKDLTGVPAELAASEYVILQVTEDDATDYTYMSGLTTFTHP